MGQVTLATNRRRRYTRLAFEMLGQLHQYRQAQAFLVQALQGTLIRRMVEPLKQVAQGLAAMQFGELHAVGEQAEQRLQRGILFGELMQVVAGNAQPGHAHVAAGG